MSVSQDFFYPNPNIGNRIPSGSQVGTPIGKTDKWAQGISTIGTKSAQYATNQRVRVYYPKRTSWGAFDLIIEKLAKLNMDLFRLLVSIESIRWIRLAAVSLLGLAVLVSSLAAFQGLLASAALTLLTVPVIAPLALLSHKLLRSIELGQ